MGGYGSGTRITKKSTVEDSRPISTSAFTGAYRFRRGTYSSGTLSWKNHAGETTASLGYTVDTMTPGGETIRLTYTIRRTPPVPVDECIPLDPVPARFGGDVWWFRCPTCARRVRTLYLPAGATRYRCRTCYGLTYASVQTHDKRLDALRRNPEALLGALRGTPPSVLALKAALKGL